MYKRTRNIIIVALLAVGGGWLGIYLNQITGNTRPPMESLGALVWLTSPALAGLLLRAFGGDGWKDAGFTIKLKQNGKWLSVGLLIYPLIAIALFGLASGIHAIDANGFSNQGFDAYLRVAGLMFAASFIKNLFEELAWRGFLTPKLEATKVHPILNHCIVGVLWWAWHLPYYYYFLDQTTLQLFINSSLPTFLFIALINLIPTAMLFGELRLISQSIWPSLVLHNVMNALSMPLIIGGFIKVDGIMGTVLTPTNDGILTSVCFGITAYGIYRFRIKLAK